MLFLVGVVVGVLGAFGLRPSPRPAEARFLSFDPETTTREELTSGWSGFERNEIQDTFVWCAAKQCTLTIELHEKRDRRVRLRLWPFRWPGAPPQQAVANVNGAYAGTLELKEQSTVWELRVAAARWKEGHNVLRFDFDYAEAPAGHIPNSDDPRPLSAAFDWLELTSL
jgi:hypothetical protein